MRKTATYKSPLSIEDRLDFIRNYELIFPQYEEMQFEKFSQSLYKILYLLFERLKSLKQSFLVLIDNKLDVEACIITGVFLETVSKFMIINKPNNVSEKEKLKNKYCANSIIQIVKNFLEAKEMFEWKKDDDVEKDFLSWLKAFKMECASLLKNNKTVNDHEHCYEELINPDKKIKDKITLLNKIYDFSTAKQYINGYTSLFKEIVDKEVENSGDYKFIKLFYSRYCFAKHGNIFSIFEVNEDNLDYNYRNVRESNIRLMSFMLGLLDEKKYCNTEFIIE